MNGPTPTKQTQPRQSMHGSRSDTARSQSTLGERRSTPVSANSPMPTVLGNHPKVIHLLAVLTVALCPGSRRMTRDSFQIIFYEGLRVKYLSGVQLPFRTAFFSTIYSTGRQCSFPHQHRKPKPDLQFWGQSGSFHGPHNTSMSTTSLPGIPCTRGNLTQRILQQAPTGET